MGNDYPEDQPYRLAMFYDNTMNGNSKYINFGKNNTMYNCGELAFHHVGDNSPDNSVSLGVYGKGSMYIKADGRIGVGTTDPKNKLDVNVTIHAREVKVDLLGWADFVFAPTYKLRPLAEVEQFIKTNGHLPEIPKAEEVQQNGVNLGEMQTKLLQKVEELTLYSIEQAKENAELKQKLADYEKEMKEIKELLIEKLK